MYIENNGVKYPCEHANNFRKDGIWFLCEGLPETISGEIKLCADEGFELMTCDTADYLRTEIANGTLTLTNVPLPEPHVPTLDELRADALKRIDGKCSGAIASGIDYNGKHYKLTAVAQQNLATAKAKGTSVIFAADGEEPTLHTAEQITAISDEAYKWGIVNTSYYAKLKVWIARETDVDVLNAIDYGAMLPADLMQELATLLAGVGINLADYGGLLT